MRNKISDKSDNIHENKMIEKALRIGGFLFPETIEEVKEFENLFGTTDVILPSELDVPTFLYSESEKANNSKIVKSPCENFAMAAREGASKLPEDIQKKIIEDIKAVEVKRERKKK